MIIAKLTIVLTLVVILMVIIFRSWCKQNPLRALIEDYPLWAYILGLLVIIDVVGIFYSVIWFLFFYL